MFWLRPSVNGDLSLKHCSNTKSMYWSDFSAHFYFSLRCLAASFLKQYFCDSNFSLWLDLLSRTLYVILHLSVNREALTSEHAKCLHLSRS